MENTKTQWTIVLPFDSEFEAESGELYDQVLDYLRECVEFGDLTAFDFKREGDTNAR